MTMSHQPIDPSRLETYSLSARQNLVSQGLLVLPTDPPGDLLGGMPDILAAAQLKQLCRAIVGAHTDGGAVVLAMGAHVIKCGLSLLIIDLMERGLVSAVALNGAGVIHDHELAMVGGTSEDVSEGLEDGSFGMARETAEAINGAAGQAAREDRGFGETLGAQILSSNLPFKETSIVAAGCRLGLPVTVHVSIGCDIVHMHANADGGAIGAASMFDFRVLTGIVADLEGGVWLNIGSSVVLPEVFLKALSVVRNVSRGSPKVFTTANLDMLRHYRPQQNVVERPGGRGLSITGHHEIMIPLLRWGVLHELARSPRRRKGT